MKDIEKRFGSISAIKNGFFDLYEGEIHSLIGENGAGKSTMMKILYGLYPKDGGTLEVRGTVYDDYSTKTAIELGIGMVHQEFMLVKEMTVLENIILGFEPKKSMDRIDFAKAKESIEEYIEKYNLDVQVNKKIQDISVGEAQRVEIIKTLYRGVDILILDEPTAVLTPQETEKLFVILENLKKLSEIHKNITIRLPLLKGLNDTEENINKTIEFMKEMKLNEIHILPYHTLGLEKYRQLKMAYMGNDYKKHTPEDLEKVREMVEAGGLKCCYVYGFFL